MKGLLKRPDDFRDRRKHIANLTDEELKARFWELTEKVVDPMLELARTHTSPSVERAVLLRMGFSSLEAKPLVELGMDHGLMSKGIGHVVFRVAKEKNMDLRTVGLEMIRERDQARAVHHVEGCSVPLVRLLVVGDEVEVDGRLGVGDRTCRQEHNKE